MGRGRGAPRIVRSNHVIQCITYNNYGLFKGDTYPYRGLFKRYGGEFDRQNHGYVVQLDKIEAIRNEIMPMVSGFTVRTINDDLRISVEFHQQSHYIEDTDDANTSRTSTTAVQFEDTHNQEYTNNTVGKITI